MKTMITNKSILFSALASVMMMTACSSEDGMSTAENSNPTTGRVMYAKGAYNDSGNSQSRMSYEDDMETNSMKLAWSAEDKFSAFINGSTVKYDFVIESKEEAYTADETFKCNSFAEDVADGTVIDAIYPAVTADAVNPQNITLSLAEQAQDGNKSTAHLKNYDYMVGHATYNASKTDELDFNFRDKGDGNSGRLASIYRIRLLLPATVTSVSKIVISCTDESGEASLVTSEKVNFANGSTSAVAATKGDVTLNITNGTPTDGEFVAYAMLFPSAVKERTIKVTTTDSGAEKIYTDTKTYDSEVIYTRGQFKYIDADFLPKNFKKEYTAADYYLWDAYCGLFTGSSDFGEGNYGYNRENAAASHSCASCPTARQMVKYLKAGYYWDDGSVEGNGLQTYTVPTGDGSTQSDKLHKGLWLRKKVHIDGFNNTEGAEKFSESINDDHKITAANAASIRTGNEYFFLPAAGGCDYDGFYDAGSTGLYWSSTPDGGARAYYLYFYDGGVVVYGRPSEVGYLPMVAE